ncbi:hypothetical protein MLD38_030203 [Melastoma candidum]|uniref:Uncharacterized protein n=1 Tax=Melastoma candidum TaxID=119954 RepID=A0ACB9MM75_9MYRT|nr:hypothetical protein MLD38_030203 [Melastoma candidum]
MESTKGKEMTASIFAEILPPRLEDAGLEDCALPPESIQEAFMKAAFAVKSRASSLLSPSTEESDLVSVRYRKDCPIMSLVRMCRNGGIVLVGLRREEAEIPVETWQPPRWLREA